MRILMVNDIGAISGGAEAVIYETRKELEIRGHEVRVLTSDSPQVQPGHSDYAFSAHDSSKAGKLAFYLHNPWGKRLARGAVSDFEPDIIHLNIVTKLSPAGVKALLRSDTPAVMSIHDLGLFYPRMRDVVPRGEYCGWGEVACCSRHAGFARYYFELLRVYLHSRNFKRLSLFIVPSEYVKGTLNRLGYDRVVTMNCPVLIRGGELSAEAPDRNGLLYAGRLEPEKGVLELLKSFSLVKKSSPAARLDIAGEGSLRDQLQSYIDDQGLGDSVRLLGLLAREQLVEWYKKTQIVVIPSVSPETFSLVGPEAMSLGIPVVASGAGGMSEWLEHGYNGLVADPRDTRAFAKAILSLLEDDALYSRLSENAAAGWQRFELKSYVDRLESLYNEVLS